MNMTYDKTTQFTGDAIELITAIKEAPPDFIQKNGAWLITIIGLVSACGGLVFTYFLKSRCSEIKCFGLSCKRQVLDLAANEIEITPAHV
jgi:hypothetical protein